MSVCLHSMSSSLEEELKPYVLNPVVSEDNEDLKNLILSILDEYGCNKAGFAAQDAELQQMFEAYQKPEHVYFVIKLEGKVVGGAGIAQLTGTAEKVCELRKMYLAPQARGKGLGDKLMKQCLESAKKFGYQSCYLETTSQMTSAQKLYLKHGFVKLSERKGETGHHGCDLFFEKRLS